MQETTRPRIYTCTCAVGQWSIIMFISIIVYNIGIAQLTTITTAVPLTKNLECTCVAFSRCPKYKNVSFQPWRIALSTNRGGWGGVNAHVDGNGERNWAFVNISSRRAALALPMDGQADGRTGGRADGRTGGQANGSGGRAQRRSGGRSST